MAVKSIRKFPVCCDMVRLCSSRERRVHRPDIDVTLRRKKQNQKTEKK